MSRAERAKGARGQLAVRRLFEQYGWSIVATASTRRGEAGTCDFLAFRNGLTLAIECNHQSTLRLPLWRRQTIANAPAGTLPVLVYCDRAYWWAEAYEAGSWTRLSDSDWTTLAAAEFARDYGRE
jgi:hypothetical protein